jgi:hypothetical protein
MRKLTTRELEDLVRWFTYHMSQDTRRQLMGDMPVHYKLLYPTVPDDVLREKVIGRIRQVEGQRDGLPASSAA